MRASNKAASVISIFILVLYTLIFFLCGLFFLFFKLDIFKDVTIDVFVSGPWGKVVGIGLVAIPLIFLFMQLLKTRKEDCIAFDNPDGEVIIAIHAIEDFVKRLGNSFPEVKDLTPSVTPSDDGIDVEMRVVLWDDKNIHAVSERLQQSVKSQIQNFFGLANVHSVKVFIARTISRETALEKEISETSEGESS